jgi:hypothetical protein
VTNKASQTRRPHPLGILHRYGGITAALLVIIVCATGILLNHTEEFGLAKTNVKSEQLLRWYGIEIPATKTYISENLFLSLAGRRLYLNAQPVDGSYQNLNGFISMQDFLLASVDDRFLVLQLDGSIIETLESFHGIPTGVRTIGLLNLLPTVETESGIWQSDQTLMQWEQLNSIDSPVNWSQTAVLPDQFATAIQDDQRGDGLPLERVILDLHSGQILGKAGPWIGDTVAALFILLALSGIWLWFKTRKRR